MRKLIKNMRLSVEENSSPYGFSVMITGSYALLNSLSQPGPLEIAAGAAGAASAFAAAEIAALAAGGDRRDQDSESAKLLGRLMSFISIGSGMAVAYLCGRYIEGAWGWFAAGCGAAFVYLLLDGLELAIAEYRQEGD